MSARPPLFRTKRFAVEAASTFVLVIGFFALGFWVASLVLANLPQVEGLGWVMTDPGDAFVVKMKLGGVAALAPLVALIASVLHRLGGRAHPSWRSTSIYFVVPIVAVSVGVGIQVNGLHTLARVDREMWGVPHSIAIRDVLPGFATQNLFIITALVLWGAAFAAARAGRKARRSSEPSEPSEG